MSDDMREAFETAILPRLGGAYFDRTKCEEYDNHVVEAAWEGWQAALASLPRVTEAELAEAIYNDVYESNFDISRLGANVLAKFIAAKFPHIVREEA